MLTPLPRILRIADAERKLSPAHRTFERQIRQIERLRATRQDWETATHACGEKHVRVLAPLQSQVLELRIGLVRALDQGSELKNLTASQRRKLSSAIAALAADVLEERDDAAIKAIYNRHNPVDYDTEEAEHAEGVRNFLEDMFDLDLGEAEGDESVDDLFARAKAQFREKQAAEEEGRAQRQAARKKTPRQLAREARVEADARRLGQSLREIYRKLVRALHPDREADPDERARKTELMQRINQAYAKRNLLQLLELQLELEHIDPRFILSLDRERLLHFNRILKEQIQELRQEVAMAEMRFRDQFGVREHRPLDPHAAANYIAQEAVRLQRSVASLEHEIQLVAEVRGLKAWLRTPGPTRRMPRDWYDEPFP